MLAYSIHGTCRITCENNIVKINAEGPWNTEYFDYLHQELIKCSDQINLDNYGAILNLAGEAIVVNGAFEKHLKFLKQLTIKAIAINLSDCITVNITKKMLDHGYGRAKIKHEFFYTEKDATHWLNKVLNQ